MGLVSQTTVGWLDEILIVTNDTEYIQDTYDVTINSEEVEGHFLHLQRSNKQLYLIYINDNIMFKDNIELYKVVAHETSHIVNAVMLQHDIEDDEFRSYLVGYLAHKVLGILTDYINNKEKVVL